MKNTAYGHQEPQLANNFYVVGLSYRKADADIRSLFSISEANQKKMLERAREEGIHSLTVISTCNRTELYGNAAHPYLLIKLLCQYTQGTMDAFEKVAYVQKNKDAVNHLFHVATGLDSQILGDFEIISQLRNGFRLSKSVGMMNPYLERLANAVIQASKRIKNETSLSSGTTSVSFAAVQYIMEQVPSVSKKNILLFGMGKIGRNTCENLVKHTNHSHITVINRTRTKAEKTAQKFQVVVRDLKDLKAEISRCDVLVVSTGAEEPTVQLNDLELNRPILILDLSVPKNVSPEVTENKDVTLVHLDELSKVTDRTLKERESQIPEAEKIINQIQGEFMDWAEQRKFAPVLKALKSKLAEIKAAEIDFQKKKIPGFDEHQAQILSDRLIQKITTHFANHLKSDATTSESVELIQQVFQLDTHPS